MCVSHARMCVCVHACVAQVTDVKDVFGLVGATAVPIICTILPSLFFLMLSPRDGGARTGVLRLLECAFGIRVHPHVEARVLLLLGLVSVPLGVLDAVGLL